MPKRTKLTKRDFETGTVVALPLENGGYGCAMIGRRWPLTGRKHNTIYCFGFGTRYSQVPSLSDVATKTIYDVVTFLNCSDMSVCNGRWKILGTMPGYDSAQWPLPVRCNQDVIVFSHPELFESVVVENDDYLNSQEFKHLPPMNGLGDPFCLEFKLDTWIRKSESKDFVRISEKSLKVWENAVKRAAADGVIPWLDKKGVLKTKPATKKVPRESSGVNKKKGKVPESPEQRTATPRAR